MKDEQFEMLMNAITQVKEDLTEEIAQVRTEFKEEITQVRADLIAINDNLTEKIKILREDFYDYQIKQVKWQMQLDKKFQLIEDREKREHQDLRDIITKRYEEHEEKLTEIIPALKGTTGLATSNQKEIQELRKVVKFLEA